MPTSPSACFSQALRLTGALACPPFRSLVSLIHSGLGRSARAKLCNPYRAHPSRALVWTTLHVRVSVVQSELSERMLRLLSCRSQVFV
jgi:hypothetical protein